MEGLFGEGLWRTTYEESAARLIVTLAALACRQRVDEEKAAVDAGCGGPRATRPHQTGDPREPASAGREGACSEKDACQQDWHCDFPHGHRAFLGKKLANDGTVPYPVSVLIAFDPDGSRHEVHVYNIMTKLAMICSTGTSTWSLTG